MEPDNRQLFIFLPLGFVVGQAMCAAVAALVESFTGRRPARPLITAHLCLILLVDVNYWWRAVGTGLMGEMHFDEYLRIAVLPMLLYAGTRILCAAHSEEPTTAVDTSIARLSPYYYLVLGFLALAFVQGVTIWTLPFIGPHQLVRVAAILLVTIALLTRDPRYHYCLVAMLAVLFLLFVAATWQARPARPSGGSLMPNPSQEQVEEHR